MVFCPLLLPRGSKEAVLSCKIISSARCLAVPNPRTSVLPGSGYSSLLSSPVLPLVNKLLGATYQHLCVAGLWVRRYPVKRVLLVLAVGLQPLPCGMRNVSSTIMACCASKKNGAGKRVRPQAVSAKGSAGGFQAVMACFLLPSRRGYLREVRIARG